MAPFRARGACVRKERAARKRSDAIPIKARDIIKVIKRRRGWRLWGGGGDGVTRWLETFIWMFYTSAILCATL